MVMEEDLRHILLQMVMGEGLRHNHTLDHLKEVLEVHLHNKHHLQVIQENFLLQLFDQNFASALMDLALLQMELVVP